MTKVITYGTYDLLHQGHIILLRRVKEPWGIVDWNMIERRYTK